MAPAFISLYKFAGGEDASFPFAIQDYQRYVFGDDKRTRQFGTDLARAFIAVTTSNQSLTNDIAVAVLSGCIPTATHNLRKHFIAYLNRHLISLDARPALKIDVYSVGKDVGVRTVPRDKSKEVYHIDGTRLAGRSLVVLGDMRMNQEWEDQVTQSLRIYIDTPITFAYIACQEGPSQKTGPSPLMASVVSPTLREIEAIAQTSDFAMNESFVHFMLGKNYAEFCSFVRRQDDRFVRLLLDYAIAGLYYDDEDVRENFAFLQWEVEARESV
ncbi:hypothetical protein T440DRAFT_168305 [Plenodomus tracheiphilus IPT5]|uniref:Uncharacterized protein n=1 Tax=Plenodomus tracheiphilus IPT5 TaxID=1408161 RepID=A0A6A7AZ81_9PLEO|nr:hypothetical protein T440DRAFT_168305 [Plenodomus tracheiphilus IPT5]